MLIGGSGWYQAFVVPPYRLADEQAHVGYVLELHAGRLPTIDTPIDGAQGGPVLQERLDLTRQRYGEVWVANNPPVAYVAMAPAAALTRALGLPGGPLLGVRLANLAFFAAAAVVAARLGRRLTGDARIGLIGAALFAVVPHVPVIAGAAFVDGLALLCGVAMADRVVAIARSGPTRRQIAWLSVWCALGAGVRPMTAVLAGVAAALALAITLWRAWRAPRPEAAPTVGRAGFWWSAVVLAVPTIVLNGWYYLRSQRLYGDPTGSERLFEKFDRVPRAEPWSVLRQQKPWAEPVRTLLNRRVTNDIPGPPLWWWELTKAVLAVLIVAAIVIVVVDQVRARRRPSPAPSTALGWSCTVVLGAVSVLLTAQHWSGGGTIHPRYLMPALVVLCLVVALPLVRLGTAWAGLALVAVLIGVQARAIPMQNRFFAENKAGRSLASPLTNPIGPAALRYAGLAALVAGFGVLVAAVVGLARSSRPSSTTNQSSAPSPSTAPAATTGPGHDPQATIARS
jgi:hypothetical protein